MSAELIISADFTLDFSVFGRFTEELKAQFDLIIVEYKPICFAKGTMIRTPTGEVAVETLSAGDKIVTAGGAVRPIVWIGRRSVDCRAFSEPADAWPVRVAAHAFGEARPSRDLYLSPQHAVAVTCLDEVLIPVKYLINGGSIAQVERDSVDYFHLELDSHDILLADNLPAESFLNTQGREGFFDNGAAYVAEHPDEPLMPMSAFCRPLVLDGPVIAAARAQLQHRMEMNGWTVTDDADLHIEADGLRLDGIRDGDQIRFVVPADTAELHLRSKSFVPQLVDATSGDGRRLGVAVAGMAVTDGLVCRHYDMTDDSWFGRGFSFEEGGDTGSFRWTNGDAALKRQSWQDLRGCFFLTVKLAAACRFRAWQAPVDASVDRSTVISLAGLRFKSAA